MSDVMNGSQVSAPPPMAVTFAEDYPGGGVHLVEPWWPARLLVTGQLVDMALQGETQYMTARRDDDNAVVLNFALTNASARYRGVETSADYAVRDIREFDCVWCTREALALDDQR